MSKLFHTVNELFESDSPILNERGHKYIQRNPNVKLTGDEWEDRHAKRFINTNTGEELERGDVSGDIRGNIFVDVIKHLAPEGYTFYANKNGYRNRIELSLRKNGETYGTDIGDIRISVGADDKPVARFEPDTYYLENLKIFNKRPRAKTIAKELAAEKKVNVTDDNIDDFMVDNSEEIKQRLAQAKAKTPGTIEEFVENINKQINKLPAGTLLRNVTESEKIKEDEDDEEETKDEGLKAAIEILRNIPKYSPQWQAMIDYMDKEYGYTRDYYNHDEDYDSKSDPRKRAIKDFESWLEKGSLDAEFVENIAKAISKESQTYKDIMAALGKKPSKTNDDDDDYYDDDDDDDLDESAKLVEAWDESMPNWLKSVILRNKKERSYHHNTLGFTSESKIEKVDFPKNLIKFSNECDDKGQLFIVKIGSSVYWYKDRRWRSLLNDNNFLSTETIQDKAGNAPEGEVEAVVVTNKEQAFNDMKDKSNERVEAREGGIYRRDEAQPNRDKAYSYGDGYGFSYDYDTKYDKSGYVINPSKYKDMLRKLNREKLASSTVIDKLATGNYVEKFNEIGKKAAEYIGKNLSINYADGDKYDNYNIDTSVISKVKEAAVNANNEIRKLMRRVDYIKTNDKSKLGYYSTPKEEGVTNLDKWLKDQAKEVEKALKAFEKAVTEKPKKAKTANESEELGDKQSYTKEHLVEYAKLNKNK